MWTKEKPKQSGFYWYRGDPTTKPEIVEWDFAMQWIATCGSDILQGKDMTYKIKGEFWAEQVKAPLGQV